ncbi:MULTISPECIES: GGDEF domain-containing protein [Rhizobium]|uniref:GGDEF domain-containing protein n=1 Tax=Rhizobium TaxID=379 RepID=UPI0007EBCA94|nr:MULTISPECIES: GGDEF domain-containing protein [Rhizobium]ANK86028.1 GGDEF domain-containing protein [Rhizobium sp. N731]ANK91937.1 GGDEF domain-containing protein [Rhizobium sp. N6212]ANK97971.1 GGDEF domain-containing protein [Rhizobium sp. N621]ANL04051.1 GGDEF domain-containing protein [Rhizobium esperanzae]ANL10097.1 GGDEF domain-containing protein [Rhizobium sp. N1341]
MNTAVAPKVQVPDVAGQITYAMRSMGVAPIPRNYELFYEAYIGSNPALTRELAALGSQATQAELDALGAQYFTGSPARVFDDAHSRISGELDGLLRILRQEQSSLESYTRLLGETHKRITSKSNASVELIESAIELLSQATGDTMAHGERTVEDVVQRSQEMDQVRKELDEYKRIANTDSLTRLSNRRAFDDRLAAVFNNPGMRPVTALLLADIDNFKKINDTYGHPVGDKILATVASVIRSNVRRDVFVARAGGEEFALIIEGNTAEEVTAIAERIRRTLETTPFKNSRTRVNYGPITVSIGICMASNAEDAGELYSKTDIALYGAKNAGRNCIVLYQDGMQKDFSKSWLIYKA